MFRQRQSTCSLTDEYAILGSYDGIKWRVPLTTFSSGSDTFRTSQLAIINRDKAWEIDRHPFPLRSLVNLSPTFDSQGKDNDATTIH